MEICDRDLRKEIDTRRSSNNPFTLKEIINVFFELICSVSEIHVNKIIHCDIKPMNILINKAGQIKLTDFGISSLV